MKVIINNAEMVPTPKKGTIIRFGDCGLFVIGIYVGRSDDNGYMVVVLQHNATPPGTLKTYKELSRCSLSLDLELELRLTMATII